MKLISEVGSDFGYGTATASHVAASAAALAELADLTTAELGEHGARPLHVQLSLFEHGAFLSPLLYGFAVLPATGELVIRPTPPRMEDRPPVPAAGLRSPESASAENPFIYAVVANHSVSVQIEHTLAMLAMLVARQEFVAAGMGDDVSEIDRSTADVDTRAITTLTDTLRTEGWRAAAKAVSDRSVAAGLPLVVTYSPVLLDAGELARRAPVLRRVYNELPAVREAIDKLATVLSQSMMVVGDGSKRIVAQAKDLLDVGSTRAYLAHLARDAFVCGNGYLSFGVVPDEDICLLQPESVTILDPENLSVAVGDTQVIHKNVLHETGAEQQGSPYGLSVLEPFVQLQVEREIMLNTLDIAEAWDQPSVPEEHRSAALSRVPLARRTLTSLENRITAILGGPKTLRAQPPADLYFPGYERMTPAADGLSFITGQPYDKTRKGRRS